MSVLLKIIIMGLATFWGIVFLSAFLSGWRAFAPVVTASSSKNPLRECYVAGFQICDFLKIKFTGTRAKQRIGQCAVIYGLKYAEYYYRLLVAKQISAAMLILVLGLCCAVFLDSVVIVLFTVIAAAGIVYYFETTIIDIMTERSQAIAKEFPTVLSTLALLVNAGLIVREAWDKISRTGNGVLYEEMRQAVLNMENGMPEMDAYMEFARRCRSDHVTKFASSLIQNLSKGNRELVQFLRQYAAESWQERKQEVRVRGEEASTKLLIPITIMMLGLMIMLCMPIMNGLGL